MVGPVRFSALDGWRGLCALMVCVFHFAWATRWGLGGNAFVQGCYLFVDFFFVLSGFVITHSYGKRINDRGELGRFMLRRFGRVWPLHFVVLMAWVALETACLVGSTLFDHVATRNVFAGNNSLEAFLSNAFLLHAFGLHDGLTWNGPSWSISAEFWTYLVFAVFCLAHLRRPAIGAALLVAGGALVLILFSPRYIDATYDYGFFRSVYGFFLGHLIYRLRAGQTVTLPPAFASILEAATLALVVAFVALAQHAPASLAAPFVFAWVVYVFSFEGGFFSRLLTGAPFRQFGLWSYSIYMVHALILQIAVYAVVGVEHLTGLTLRAMVPSNGWSYPVIAFASPLAMNLFCAGFVLVVVAVASQTYRYVEEPWRLYFNALARSGRRHVGQPTIAHLPGAE